MSDVWIERNSFAAAGTAFIHRKNGHKISSSSMDYIGKADAVLLAVKPDALSVEGISTITTVLDYVGENKKKVYIIGTRKDSLLYEGDQG